MIRLANVLILLLICGCGPLVISPDNPQPSHRISDEDPAASDIWYALAKGVDQGWIPTSRRLAQFVVVLARSGDLTADDVAAFDAAFPDATKSDRALSADDARRLKDLAK